ncbi:DUF6631 family protein [Citrobacter braakii]|uniref:DUF6631 family protein n=1 Tax=Citrobacter braakii TaxID=57706 RepID=UPI00397513D1
MSNTQDELAVLLPFRELTLAGVQVTVHEYTLKEQLQHRVVLKTLSDAFAQFLSTGENVVRLDSLLDVMAGHYDAVIDAAAVSCGQSPGWIADLTGDDVDTLLFAWWEVNAGFFTRAALRPLLERLAVKHQAGLKSSPS